MTTRKTPGSVSAYFGSQVRKRRKELGLTQDQLGEKIRYAGTMVASVETGKRPPSRQFVEGVERVLGGDGSFLELWPAINEEKYPTWFQNFAELEEQATCMQQFEAQLVPGLLQTEEYSRTLFSSSYPPMSADEIEQRVASRLDRREILERKDPPRFWALLDEAVLRRPIGSHKVMSKQCEYIIETCQRAHVNVQILPFRIGWHSGLNGSFTVLETREGERWGYTERMGQSTAVTDLAEIAVYTERMRALHATALSPEASLEFLSSVIGDLR